MPDDEFEIYKEAVLTKLQEKDISLSKQHERHWGEISTHHYMFDRQDKDIEVLQTIKKSEFIDHFTKTFFSDSSKRLDLHLNADIHKEEQEEYRKINSEHEVMKNLKRVNYKNDLASFKT